MRVVILDNYDSFTFNLYQRVAERTGHKPIVVRNDQLSLAGVASLDPQRIIISPGPGSPEDPRYFGVSGEVIAKLGQRIPVLGVCLGHQGIVSVFGGRVVRAKIAVHGKTSAVFHNGAELFRGIPRAFEAMRYHSLVADPDTLPDCLEVIAKTWDDVIMGVRHKAFPIWGVQFHPESIGTPSGPKLLENFVTRGRC